METFSKGLDSSTPGSMTPVPHAMLPTLTCWVAVLRATSSSVLAKSASSTSVPAA